MSDSTGDRKRVPHDVRPGEGQRPAKPPLLRAKPLEDPKPVPPPQKAPPTHHAPPAPRVPATPEPAAGGSFDFSQLAPSEEKPLQVRRKSTAGQTMAIVGGSLAGLCLVIAVVVWSMSSEGGDLKIKPILPQEIDELATLEVAVRVELPDGWDGEVDYSLAKAPEGAKIDPKTGRFTWTPTEKQGPDDYAVIVRVASAESGDVHAEKKFLVVVNEANQPPVVDTIEDQVLEPGGTVTLSVKARDPDDPPRRLQYRLLQGARAGARLDPRTGRFEWTPQGIPRGTEHRFVIQVEEVFRGGLSAKQEFTVRLQGTTGPVDRLVADLRARGAVVEKTEEAMRTPLPGTCRALKVDAELVGAFEYESESEAVQSAKLPRAVLERFGTTAGGKLKASVFQGGRLVAFYVGDSDRLRQDLGICVGDPVVPAASESPFVPVTPAVAKPEKPEVPPPQDPAAHGDDVLLALCEKKKLFSPSEYRTIRGVFAGRFERLYEQQIRQAYGADYEEMTAWLDEHRDIREELYTAIDPAHDNIPAALGLFNQLRKQFPKQIAPYANLAIAVAVVWDNERGVYDYAGHQRRSRSKLPDARLGAVENFKYIVDAERFVQGRGQFLPWEFLTNVVNHRTPVAERQWALASYLPKRVMVGKCYADVPYDHGMLDSGGKVVRLEGKDYTLPNLRQFGGVCAMQADFAARVGKSLGVPAAYVGGTAKSGEGHAWVMWVELKGVTRTSIGFTLESHGRYRGDRYYVGHLRDPQTGQGITDRQLELRLHTVGMNPLAKRQADFLMAAYPMLRERTEMDVPEQLGFLNQVIRLCPGNEASWTAIARMSRDGVLTKKHHKTMLTVLDRLFATFTKFPDFTWTVFDDLVAFQDVPQQRAQLYGRLVVLYEGAGRPDLACEARLKYADYLVAEKRHKEAIEGLAFTIKKFPDEGRYVPRMLDKLEKICREVEGAEEQLVLFYQQFLPMIPKKRGSRPSPYCIRMYQRGIERFNQAGQPQLAMFYQAELQRLRGPEKP